MDSLDELTFPQRFEDFIRAENISTRQAALALGCSESTLLRLLGSKTRPSSEMLVQASLMVVVGHRAFSRLSRSKRDRLTGAVGVVAGGGLGFGAIATTVAEFGIVPGLSAAGMSSGLGALGGLVGGGMGTGLLVVGGMPLVGVGAGYGFVWLVRRLTEVNRLNAKNFDPRWEEHIPEV